MAQEGVTDEDIVVCPECGTPLEDEIRLDETDGNCHCPFCEQSYLLYPDGKLEKVGKNNDYHAGGRSLLLFG